MFASPGICGLGCPSMRIGTRTTIVEQLVTTRRNEHDYHSFCLGYTIVYTTLLGGWRAGASCMSRRILLADGT